MMLCSNREIKSKKDSIKIVIDYMSRWRLEEYFRVRDLKVINNLNILVTYTIGFMRLIIEKMGESLLMIKIILILK